MKESWLVVTYFANIDAMAPSHHIDDRLPFFKKAGIDLHLLSSPCGIRRDDVQHTRVPSPAPSGIRYETRYFLRRKTTTKLWFKFWEILLLLPVYPFYFLEKIVLRLDSTWSWFITASAAAVVLAVKKRPSVIYSTGGPVSAHLAAMAAAAVTRTPHIAEFQDPLVHQYAAPGKFERHFIRHVERLIFSRADSVVFLTKKAADNARRRYNKGKASAVYAGAVPPATHSRFTRGEFIRVAHFGSLGGSRNLDHLLGALSDLFREQPGLQHCFRLDLYGNNSKEVMKTIELFPFPHAILCHGKVRRSDAVESMQRADLLLLIQNTDDVSFETIPSKAYEYLQAGRPILALVYRNPELQHILESMGHTVVQADDADGIKKALGIFISQWQRSDLPPPLPESPYTVEKAVGELIGMGGRTNAGGPA